MKKDKNKKSKSIEKISKNWKKLTYFGLAGFLFLVSGSYAVWRNAHENSAQAAYIPAPSFYKDYYSTCTGSTHTLRANAAGASMAIWALTPTGWIKVASKNGVIAGTTISVSKSRIASLGGSGSTGLRGFVTTSAGITSPYDFCYSHWGG